MHIRCPHCHNAIEIVEDMGFALAQRESGGTAVTVDAQGKRWVKRNPAVAALTAVVVFVLLGGIVATSYWAKIASGKSRQAVESLVSALETAAPSQVRNALNALMPFRDDAKPVLIERYEALTGERKLHAAYGMAACERCELAFLVDSIAGASPGECDNLADAMEYQRDSALLKLKVAVAAATAKQDWKLKTRLATVALYLNDPSVAADMLRGEPTSPEAQPWDPIQRTMFIECFPTWPGNVEKLAEVLQTCDDKWLRSGICLAIGSVKEPSVEAKKVWQDLWTRWSVNQRDSGTHSAAIWGLRTWQLPLPEVSPQQLDRKGFDWQCTKAGLTMIRIPAGQVVLPLHDIFNSRRTIHVANEFWLSDREISVGQYYAFLDDQAYQYEKPEKPDIEAPSTEQDKSYAARMVSWYDAVMFCNWLSRREGYQPCYVKDGKERFRDAYDKIREFEAWTLITEADGYRLPTDDEWEYACRARTTTLYCFGDTHDVLNRYAVFMYSASFAPDVPGRKLCNAWGLFDMHGNVSEWCQDWYREGHTRVYRGGCWADVWSGCMSTEAFGFQPYSPSALGFRVARGGIGNVEPPAHDAPPSVLFWQEATATENTALKPPEQPPLRFHPEQLSAAENRGLPVIKTNSIGMKMTLIPSGEFMMGNSRSGEELARMYSHWNINQKLFSAFDEEQPQRRVNISRPFYLGMYEVTVGQFKQFAEATNYLTKAEQEENGRIAGGIGYDARSKRKDLSQEYNWRNPGFSQSDDHPVVIVNWNDAVAFCNWLSDQEGNRYSLPTEAQWEYACRGGTTTQFCNGDDLERVTLVGNVADAACKAHFKVSHGPMSTSDGYVFTSPVGKFRANDYGLYDMHGNVSEWCADWFDRNYYAKSPVDDPAGPAPADNRVIRGGSWESIALWCRSPTRNAWEPSLRGCRQGFRVALDAGEEVEPPKEAR